MLEDINKYIADYNFRCARHYIQNMVKYNINQKIQKKEIQDENLEAPLSIYPTKSEDIIIIV